ncbi:hypothetical protein [Rickettsiella endosymbiont of Dermanyssus gallinae]|uniref:hypothetical protein n=1 Tax=Rickettsiella endosymbiont of Dermanyssus gallinae TaxID=2856608 RepID=UPI001C5294F7|nr:hypothetical protein [Rickettsiella endosymbiont of Dermanyssus gallinae]
MAMERPTKHQHVINGVKWLICINNAIKHYLTKLIKFCLLGIKKIISFFKVIIYILKYILRLNLFYAYILLKKRIPAKIKLNIKYKFYRYPTLIKWSQHLRHWLKLNQSSNEELLPDKIILFLLDALIIKSLIFFKKEKFRLAILQKLLINLKVKQQLQTLIYNDGKSVQKKPLAYSSFSIETLNTLSKTAQYIYMDIQRAILNHEK